MLPWGLVIAAYLFVPWCLFWRWWFRAAGVGLMLRALERRLSAFKGAVEDGAGTDQ